MRVFILLLMGFISPIYAFEEQSLSDPKGWIVCSETWYNVTDPNVCVDQHRGIKNYYTGDGKIVRNIYILLGMVPAGQEEIVLGKETTTKFEKALANVKSEIKVLHGRSSEPSENTESYTLGKLFFPNKIILEALIKQSLKNGDSIDTAGNEYLDFVFKTLSSPKVD